MTDDGLMRARKKPLSIRGLFAVMALAWLAGGIFLLAAWRSGVEDRRMSTAPQCAQSQVFTPEKCRIELDGTLISLTISQTQVDVGGHHLIMDTVPFKHDYPELAGSPVRVTMYRGRPIHIDIEGQRLKIDARDLPDEDRSKFGYLGLFFVIAGSVNFAVALLGRRNRA
ncbi:hypothetical protein [Dactylosporangium sp. CA-092794]|uniref:hypothetical protein n=1 Tax=Dactylosporangium sp. CA-092794 TaxID=3239929 RepID=UPI003D910555